LIINISGAKRFLKNAVYRPRPQINIAHAVPKSRSKVNIAFLSGHGPCAECPAVDIGPLL